MIFEATTPWAERSSCGRYTVSIALHEPTYTCQAWKRTVPGARLGGLIGTFATKQEARDRCEADAALAAT